MRCMSKKIPKTGRIACRRMNYVPKFHVHTLYTFTELINQ